MLVKILQILSDGNSHSTVEIARRLDGTPELVKAAAAQLVRMGYLEEAGACGVGDCGCRASCAGSLPACNPQEAKTWVLRQSGKWAAHLSQKTA